MSIEFNEEAYETTPGEYPEADLREATRGLPAQASGAIGRLTEDEMFVTIDEVEYPASELEFEPAEEEGKVRSLRWVKEHKTWIAVGTIAAAAAITAVRRIHRHGKIG